MRFGAALLVLWSVRAAAQPTEQPAPQPTDLTPEAQAHLDEGQRHFEAKEYDLAIAEFRAGYAIVPDRVFIYTEAQARRYAHKCDLAIELYRRFLATDPPKTEAAFATYNIDQCKLELPPPPPPPKPREILPPAREPTGPWYRDALGMSLVGGSVACAAASATALWFAHRHAESADSAPTFGEYEHQVDLTNTDRTVGLVIGGAAAALAIGSAIRFATRPTTMLVATPTMAGGAGIELHIRF